MENQLVIATWGQFHHPHTIETVIYVLIVWGATKSGWFDKGWKFSIHLLIMPFLLALLKIGLINNLVLLILALPIFYILLVLPYQQVIKNEK